MLHYTARFLVIHRIISIQIPTILAFDQSNQNKTAINIFMPIRSTGSLRVKGRKELITRKCDQADNAEIERMNESLRLSPLSVEIEDFVTG